LYAARTQTPPLQPSRFASRSDVQRPREDAE